MDTIAFLLSNGRSTEPGSLYDLPGKSVNSIDYAIVPTSNHWSSTEYNQNNAWNVNFNNGNLNNNNKNNSYEVRAVAALDEETKEGWVEAFHDCCRNKKSSFNCDDYRSGNWELDLWKLVYEVYSRNYAPKPSTCFIVTRPTYREVFAANFRDRIVQHWICLRLDPLFEERFIEQGNVSHNCRKGFGTNSAVHALERDIREVSQNYTKDAWVAKIDIQSFFMSIDLEILWKFLEKFIKERYNGNDIDTLLYLTEITVKHRPQKNCIRRSPIEMWDKLPPHKSLFNKDDKTGEAIGNITAQHNANLDLSIFLEVILPYVRKAGARIEQFVDDIPCVSPTKGFCRKFRKLSKQILKEKLNLTVHPNKFYIQHVKKGISYVGQVIMPGRRYISNRTLSHFTDRLRFTEKLCKKILAEGPNEKNLFELRHAASSLNSYLGFMVHCASYRIRKKLIQRECHAFWRFFYTHNFAIVKIKKEYDFRIYLINKEIKDYEMDLFSGRARPNRKAKPLRTDPTNSQLQCRNSSGGRPKRQ